MRENEKGRRGMKEVK